jgi:hypothetical protein
MKNTLAGWGSLKRRKLTARLQHKQLLGRVVIISSDDLVCKMFLID